MPPIIIETTENVTLIGGGDVNDYDLTWSLGQAPVVVAADGGANFAQFKGITPDAVIGDFDSIRRDVRAALPESNLHPIAEQDSTDFDKCLRSISAPMIIGLGFLGRRLDHQLAALSTLVARPDVPCLLLSEFDVAFLAPLQITLDMPVGTRVSLYPMGQVVGRAKGLQYPLDGLQFAPDGQIGTSNVSTREKVDLQFSDRKMVVILPRDQAAMALAVLRAAHAG